MKLACTSRIMILALGIYATVALTGALISQFGFGLHPCELCLWQRYPYAAILLLGVIGAASRPRPWFFILCAALFLADAGIAAYHAGVEWGVFEGLDGCSAGALPANATLEDIRRQLMEAPVVSCKDAAFVFLGLSMAGWNVLYALGGVALSVLALRKIRTKEAT